LFTLFDFTDNVPVSRLWVRRNEKSQAKASPKPGVPKADWRPFHVINMALNHVAERVNLTAEDQFERQERKAASFTVSPLWCGSAEFDAFRPASEYGGREPIALGTAMAISGAAASPNVGYHSSPLVSFVLTFSMSVLAGG
jgi:hypothetical protein